MRLHRKRIVLFAATLPLLQMSVASASPGPEFEMPFLCGQEWYGATRADHSPSSLAIDWNRADDLGDPVVAADSGVVSRVEDRGEKSYGLFVVIDHGDGRSTLYAHLSAEYVTVGERVDQGELIALVGSSGGSSGPHLHYEQRLNGTDQRPSFHGDAFVMGTTLASRNCVDTPLAGDWNGDGVSQIGLFRRGAVARFRLAWGADVRRVPFGGSADAPLIGDWDGDGVSDVGVRHFGSSTFLLRQLDGSSKSIAFGLPSDRAITGDWNGDGRWDVGIWRPSEGAFYLRKPSGAGRRIVLGSVSSLPVTGDWNGDGRWDVGVFDDGVWTLQVLTKTGIRRATSITFGSVGDLPVTGDWNGDSATEVGTWSPSTALFTLRKAKPQSVDGGTYLTRVWGRSR